LLDTSLDGNITGRGAAKKGSHLDIVEGTADKVKKPIGEGRLLEDLEDPGVVNGVERLGRVKKEDELLDIVSDALVEEVVEVLDVGVPADTGEEALLSGVQKGGDRRHKGPRQCWPGDGYQCW
jgi:hypothetical protein